MEQRTNRNRVLILCGCVLLLSCAGSRTVFALTDPPRLTDGVQAFQQHRWLDAMADFIEILRLDPDNAQAHKYIPLAIREIEAQNHAVVREMRLTMLIDTSKRMENNRVETKLVDSAVADITHSEQRNNEERWNRWLEEAKVERQQGHLLAANDLVLRIISEKPDQVGAQKELSLLQSDIHEALEKSSDLLIQERYALEGFYAYGQS